MTTPEPPALNEEQLLLLTDALGTAGLALDSEAAQALAGTTEFQGLLRSMFDVVWWQGVGAGQAYGSQSLIDVAPYAQKGTTD